MSSPSAIFGESPLDGHRLVRYLYAQAMKPSTAKSCSRRAAANPFGRCLYFTANAVARHVSRLAEEAFAPTGLNPSSALLLSLIVRRPGIAPSAAAEVLHLAPSSVTRFADELVRRGLVRRAPSGRLVLLHPTGAGRALLPEVQASWEELYARYSRDLGKRRGSSLARELAEVAEILGARRE